MEKHSGGEACRAPHDPQRGSGCGRAADLVPLHHRRARRDAGQARHGRSLDRRLRGHRRERGRRRQARHRAHQQAKGGILGRPAELLVEDSANDVGTGVQKTRKLIERDQVNFIIGDVNSGIALAMAGVTSEKKVLHIVSGGHTDAITGKDCQWNVFRVCNTTTMGVNAIADTLMEKLGKKWYFLTPDYAYGHSVQAAFVKKLKAGGRRVRGRSRAARHRRLLRLPHQGEGLRAQGAHQRHGRRRPGQQPEAVRPVRSAQARWPSAARCSSSRACARCRRKRASAGGRWSGGGTSRTTRTSRPSSPTSRRRPARTRPHGHWFGYVSVQTIRAGRQPGEDGRRAQARARDGRLQAAARGRRCSRASPNIAPATTS